MPRGDKNSYTSKQKRQAEHIEEGYEDKGVSKKTAQARAWATVNKQDGGAKKKPTAKKKTAKKKATPKKTTSKRSTAAGRSTSKEIRSSRSNKARSVKRRAA